MMTIQKRRSYLPYAIASFLLLLPAVGMLISPEVRWSGFDFLIAAILLFSAAFAVDLISRNIKNRQTALILAISLIVLLILLWIELAVGIFGSPIAGT